MLTENNVRLHFIERTAYRKGYRVTEDGKAVISPFSGKARTPNLTKQGYPQFTVKSDFGISRNCTIHRLQAYQKYGERIYEAGLQVRHKNDIPTDNSVENILLGTASENQMDKPPAVRRRTALNASRAHQKYDPIAVRAFYAACHSYPITQAQFGISSKGTLHYILNGRPSPLPNFGAGGVR